MDDFQLHDVSDFPVVRPRPGPVSPGAGVQWVREMDALLARAQPFVMVMDGSMHEEEAHEDRRERAIWMKQNRDRMAALCRLVVAVEPDAVRRAAFKVQAAIAVKAFGVPMDVTATQEEAALKAATALAA
ncbi:MAG: hypothetical protein PW843_22000 [Azospirillaceae bacterium]|nr:hypothetical protein [Azospirillaceae bacterium]